MSGSAQADVQGLIFVIGFTVVKLLWMFESHFFSLCTDADDSGLVDVYDHQCDVRVSGVQPGTPASKLQ